MHAAQGAACMALKFKFKTKDEIPAEHLPLYAERDGGWVLDVDGAVEKTRLDEFRTTNVSLIKERDDLKKRFDGIDPDEGRRLMAGSDDGLLTLLEALLDEPTERSMS